MDGIKIVDSRERSTPASSWTEYLCVRPLEHSLYELSIRMFEYLGEYSDYADEDGNIPDFIDGKAVVSVEDGCICGGNLVCISEDDADVVRFRDANAPTIVAWLRSKLWSLDATIPQLKTIISET